MPLAVGPRVHLDKLLGRTRVPVHGHQTDGIVVKACLEAVAHGQYIDQLVGLLPQLRDQPRILGGLCTTTATTTTLTTLQQQRQQRRQHEK